MCGFLLFTCASLCALCLRFVCALCVLVCALPALCVCFVCALCVLCVCFVCALCALCVRFVYALCALCVCFACLCVCVSRFVLFCFCFFLVFLFSPFVLRVPTWTCRAFCRRLICRLTEPSSDGHVSPNGRSVLNVEVVDHEWIASTFVKVIQPRFCRCQIAGASGGVSP